MIYVATRLWAFGKWIHNDDLSKRRKKGQVVKSLYAILSLFIVLLLIKIRKHHNLIKNLKYCVILFLLKKKHILFIQYSMPYTRHATLSRVCVCVYAYVDYILVFCVFFFCVYPDLDQIHLRKHIISRRHIGLRISILAAAKPSFSHVHTHITHLHTHRRPKSKSPDELNTNTPQPPISSQNI